MPKVDAERIEEPKWWQEGWGWGCTCPAYRRVPNPKQTLGAFHRAPQVMVNMCVNTSPPDELVFEAGSGDTTYTVTVTKGGTTEGLCKHVVACMAMLHPWVNHLMYEAERREAECQELRKQLKRLSRKSPR